MSDTKALTLTDFLMARLDEDETNARQLSNRERWVIDSDVKPEIETFASPDRVLAQVSVYRTILKLHSGYTYCEMCGDGQYEMPCPTLSALAHPWINHPDYRDEWA